MTSLVMSLVLELKGAFTVINVVGLSDEYSVQYAETFKRLEEKQQILLSWLILRLSSFDGWQRIPIQCS